MTTAAAKASAGSKRKTLDSYFGSKQAKTTRTSATTTASSSSPSSSKSPVSAPKEDQQQQQEEATESTKNKEKEKEEVAVSSEERDRFSLEYSTMDPSWLKHLRGEFTKPYFLSLKRFLETQAANKKTVYPAAGDVYSWSRYAPFSRVRVVILGQDPYHGPGQAHGLAFSVQPGVRVPPSLANIYKGLARDFPGKFVAPKHGYLGGWAEQGVLLLNAALTVEAHKANSHAGQGWEQFTDAVIAAVNKSRPHVVFMLWGSYAQKKGAHVDGKKHLVLKSVHP
ncbi:uracil DNA glycosylase, partial [Coemansia sp. RSA 2681]